MQNQEKLAEELTLGMYEKMPLIKHICCSVVLLCNAVYFYVANKKFEESRDALAKGMHKVQYINFISVC